MSRHFPSTAFGQCANCGRKAADNGGTSADVSPSYTEKRGLNLEYYRGEWWCKICIDNEKGDDYSERVADRTARDSQFRASAGFTTIIK